MSGVPSQIWICTKGKEPPDWVVERMTTAEVAANGSFEITASDGDVTVEPGFAVFEFNSQIYACRPNQVQEKLANAAGAENEVVADLAHKTETMRAQHSRGTMTARKRASPTADGYQLRLKPMIGTPPAPQFLPVEMLQVDDTYQRSIEGGASRKLIVKIAENWDWRLCLPLLVSRRDGKMFVIDGQHRKEAAELRGDIAHLPVVVFDFNDPKAEAELFVEANRSRRAMSKLDDFHAAVVAGDPKILAVNDVVIGAGLSVGRVQAWQYWKPGEVVFVGSIQRLLHTQGKPPVAHALGLIARAFEGCTLVGVGAVFEGLVAFTQQRLKEAKPVDDSLMASVLGNVGIPGWKEAVEGVDSASERADAMLRAIAEAYVEAEAE